MGLTGKRRCVPTAKKDTHRPGLAPALGLRAGNGGVFILPQTGSRKETFVMSFTHWFANSLGSSSRVLGLAQATSPAEGSVLRYRVVHLGGQRGDRHD